MHNSRTSRKPGRQRYIISVSRFVPLFLLALSSCAVYADSCAHVRDHSDAWVKTQIDVLVPAAHAAFDKDEATPAYEKVLGGITDTIRKCKLSQDENFVVRHREFFDYVTVASLDQQPGHELGFGVSDRQYFAETRKYVQVPTFLLTQRFLRTVSRDETLDLAKSYLRLINSSRRPDEQLIFFSFVSRHLGTPDNNDSYKRLLIVVPGSNVNGIPEKWVQFGVTDRGSKVRTRNLSVLAAVGNPNGRYNVFFKDFYRIYRANGSIGVNGRWELGYGGDNCVSCHKSGILPIFPEAGSVNPNEQQAVQAVNARFRTYGSPMFEPYLDVTKFGPGIGSSSPALRLKTFAGNDLSPYMNCAACHNSERLGAFSWPMNPAIINSYVTSGLMPLESHLESADRIELYRRLIQEYFDNGDTDPGILKSWLLGKQRGQSKG